MSCVNCSSNNGKVELTILWQAGSEEFEVHNNIHELNKFTFFFTENENMHLLKIQLGFSFSNRFGVPIIENRQRCKKQSSKSL